MISPDCSCPGGENDEPLPSGLHRSADMRSTHLSLRRYPCFSNLEVCCQALSLTAAENQKSDTGIASHFPDGPILCAGHWPDDCQHFTAIPSVRPGARLPYDCGPPVSV